MVPKLVKTRWVQGAIVAGLIGVWLMPATIPLESLAVVPCPFRMVTGIPCPGCGITRACLHLTAGHWHQAWHYHPFAFLLVPFFFLWAIAPKQFDQTARSLPQRVRNTVGIALLVLLLARWAHVLFHGFE